MTTNHCPRSILARIVYRIPRYSIRLSFALNWDARRAGAESGGEACGAYLVVLGLSIICFMKPIAASGVG